MLYDHILSDGSSGPIAIVNQGLPVVHMDLKILYTEGTPDSTFQVLHNRRDLI